jgi:hypothetical protein
LKNNGGEGDPRSELTSIIHTEKWLLVKHNRYEDFNRCKLTNIWGPVVEMRITM